MLKGLKKIFCKHVNRRLVRRFNKINPYEGSKVHFVTYVCPDCGKEFTKIENQY